MRSKTLHALIFLLATVAGTLVFVNRSSAQRGVIHIQVRPAQARAKKEKVRNFDASTVFRPIALLTAFTKL